MQLRFPEFSILHGQVAVGWATVPETPVHEYSQFEFWEYEIGSAEECLIPPPSGDPPTAKRDAVVTQERPSVVAAPVTRIDECIAQHEAAAAVTIEPPVDV
jgi:hypothetical protein